MRLDLLDERSRSFVLALIGDSPSHRKPRRSRKREQKAEAPSDQRDAVPRLAEQLINNICGRDSLGHVYQFLLRTYGAPAKARAEFEQYLEGNWSPEWIKAARLAVEEQQGRPESGPGRTSRRRRDKPVLSPVGEPMGDTEARNPGIDKERVRSETNLEVDSNY